MEQSECLPAAFPHAYSEPFQGKKLTGQSVLMCHFSRHYPHTSKHKDCLASSNCKASQSRRNVNGNSPLEMLDLTPSITFEMIRLILLLQGTLSSVSSGHACLAFA